MIIYGSSDSPAPACTRFSRSAPGLLSRAAALVAILLATHAVSLDAQRIYPRDFNEGSVENMKQSVAHVMGLSEEELRDRVPVESGGIWFTDCPNCDFGSQDRGRFDWDPEKPHQIQCQGCEYVYPGNAEYPDDSYHEVDAPDGVHRFHYWENPKDGYRIYFRAHADYLHREYLERVTRLLGLLYAATGDDRYARRAATLLHRFAEVVPGYAYIFDFPYRQKLFSPYTENRLPVARYRTSLWTRWAYNDIPRPLLEAYDALHDWDGWSDIGGAETRETIEEDLFAFIIEFVLGFEDPLTNMSPRIWRDTIMAGRILDRPEWVHESIRRFERMLDQQFLHDGHWFETSPSYHAMTISGMRTVMEAAQGHTDPEGFADPETGRRFDDLDLSRDVPQYGLAIRAMNETRLPDGRLLPVNDTWAVHGRSDQERREPRQSSESLLMPGLGVAILGAGDGDEQIFSWLNFTSGIAHKQRDTLSIGLFAHGREVLPDIGYTHTRYRRSWASSMMSHNTVVVDGREPAFDEDHAGNRLVAFATNAADFHLAAAESESAYGDRTGRYRRTLMLLGGNSTEAYLLDVFEVTGGDQHDYLLHGEADRDSTAEIHGTDLTAYDGTLINPGSEYEEPVGEHDEMGKSGSFSFIRDLHRGAGGNPLTLDLRLEESPSDGSRTVLAAMDDAEVFLGRSPSLRRAEESDARINDYFRPSFVLRRRGEDLESVFVAAHEPVQGEPRLKTIHSRRDGDRLWISVAHADGRDYISIAPGREGAGSLETPAGVFSTDAAYAVVRLDPDGAVIGSHLVEGEQLRFGDSMLQGSGAFTGEVLAVNDEGAGKTTFDLDRESTVDRPHTLIVTFPDDSSRAFTVTGVEESASGARVQVREAAGFRIGPREIEITSYPQRTIKGTTLPYRLIDSAHRE